MHKSSVFIKEAKNHCTNYSPISLFTPNNEILKSCVYTRLYYYVEENKMLPDSQYGFRSDLSTSIAIYDGHGNPPKNLEEKCISCMIFDLTMRLIRLNTAYKLEYFLEIEACPVVCLLTR